MAPHGFHRVAYVAWGAEGGRRPVICAHGLTRNSRDFDTLARALALDGRQVVCPDVAGRGRSAWLADAADYGYPLYLSDMAALMAHLGAEAVDWIGTSMGGIIGMMLAAQPDTPIRRLVINDVGPFIPKAALERIRDYLGLDPKFADLAAVERHLRRVHAPFGALSDAQWRAMALHSCRDTGEGWLGLAYDPAIAAAFNAAPLTDVDLWPVWDAIRCPVLVLRGQDSDLLLPETLERMTLSRPHVRAHVIPGCGHAPALMDAAQIAVIRDWLERTPA